MENFRNAHIPETIQRKDPENVRLVVEERR